MTVLRGLDTNVLVRYVTEDDSEQLAEALEVIDGAKERDERLFLSVVVVCEFAWVLRGGPYRYSRDDLAHALRVLLEIPLFEIHHRNEVHLAVEDYATGRADFADYLIGRLSEAAGCRDTVTFDSRLSGDRLFSDV